MDAKAEILSANPTLMDALMDAIANRHDHRRELVCIKDELLSATALRVHDGQRTFLVTFDQSEVDAFVAQRKKYVNTGATYVDEVPGDMVAKWRAEIVRTAKKFTFSHANNTLKSEDGNSMSEELAHILYSHSRQEHLIYGAVAHIEGFPRSISIANA